MNLPAKIYTQNDIESARKKGKYVGWLQGAGVVVGAGFLWNLLGWIPMVLVVGLVVYGLYKLLAKPSKDEPLDVSDLDIDDLKI